MVEVDIGNHRDARVSDVGRVQAPAHAHLEHHKGHPRAGEVQESRSGQVLKETGTLGQRLFAEKPVHRLPDFGEGPGKVLVRDFTAIHPDSFIDANQVRRRVEPRVVARLLENARQNGRRGAFAIRARDNGCRILSLRVAERGQDGLNRLQAELHPAYFASEFGEVREAFGVIHNRDLGSGLAAKGSTRDIVAPTFRSARAG